MIIKQLYIGTLCRLIWSKSLVLKQITPLAKWENVWGTSISLGILLCFFFLSFFSLQYFFCPGVLTETTQGISMKLSWDDSTMYIICRCAERMLFSLNMH